jgi:hypothetical protein
MEIMLSSIRMKGEALAKKQDNKQPKISTGRQSNAKRPSAKDIAVKTKQSP